MKNAKSLGRKSNLDYTRAMLLCMQLLQNTHFGLSAQEISKLLHIDFSAAIEIIHLLLMVSDDEGGSRLALYLREAPDDVTLEYIGHDPLVQLSLNDAEILASLAALLHCGLDSDSLMLKEFIELYGTNDSFDPTLIDTLQAQNLKSLDHEQNQKLQQLADLLEKSKTISFSYNLTSTKEERSLFIQDIYLEEAFVYVSGIDLEKNAYRTFRLDKMSCFKALTTATMPKFEESSLEETRTIRVYVYDWKAFLDINWMDYKILAVHPDYTEVELLYFGGTWLIQRLCAMGNMIEIIDAKDVQAAVQSYAEEILDLANTTQNL